MKHELVNKPDFDVLVLSGDIDLHHSPTLRERILSSLKGGRPLLIDMQEVSYIDSSGIASLVEGFQTAKSSNLHFGLLSISSPTLQVLAITRLDKIFSLYETEDSFIEILEL
ncbi:MAG: STAS domain-containing protein [Gammaproteobacteria bacterium]|nr:STAS domain-containing protein [Pseudomonadales bacterium]MCP5349327.1 STAS domain-containing protein [Pseudomonadales bacterium]